jgi:nucleoside-diphosphate-sugar epimerase
MNGGSTTVLVTGASGFVGRTVVKTLAGLPGVVVRAAARRDCDWSDGVVPVRAPDLAATADWSACVRGADVVVHLAARVHQLRDTASDPLTEFRRVNTEGTLALARHAAEAGARRFIFLSSIKVNGEQTLPGKPFRADDAPCASDPYAISKLEAEDGLRDLASRTALKFVIIRPPLVYGPGVGANFLAMIRAVDRGLPLPLGSIHNRRSLIAVGNLADLIARCVHHQAAANRLFLASDDHDLSTTQMLREIGRALGKPARLVPVPASWLRAAASMAGRREVARRLCDSLQVDISETRNTIAWQPPLSVAQAFDATAAAYLRERQV